MQAIRAHEDSHKQYAKRLLKEGNIKQDQLDKIDKNVHNILQKAFEEAKVLLCIQHLHSGCQVMA
jgi:2-oxoglutarate dehydrogenase complex dehydrogenase (E1) component-like enzyme